MPGSHHQRERSMRYAILSDIHANLEALQAVLARITALGADTVVCLGDLVGYNANPNECVESSVVTGITCIMGNHDAVACGLEDPGSFNPAAKESVLWTRERLTLENQSFPARVAPGSSRSTFFFICHGSIHDTNRVHPGDDDVRSNFFADGRYARPAGCLFLRHTHRRAVHRAAGNAIVQGTNDENPHRRENAVPHQPRRRGQPRDGDPRAAFLIYDAKARK